MRNPFIPTEEEEQKLLIEYLDLKGIKYTHIPNSTYTKSWQVKLKNKAMGVRPGFPDLVMIINDRLVLMELKRQKGGVLSPHQKEWIEALAKCQGIEVFVCCGFDEARKKVDLLLDTHL